MSPHVRSFVSSVVFCLIASAASAATVSGTVSNAANQRPLPSMVVAAYDAAGFLRNTAITDADGRYSLTVTAGNYRLLAYDPNGIYATSFDGAADSFETSPVTNVVTTATVNFALVKAGVVAGNVMKASGGGTLGAVVVTAYNLSGTRRAFTITDSSGDYSLALPPGDYKLVAYDENGLYATTFYRAVRTFAEAMVVHVTEAASAAANFRLEVAARLQGVTADAGNGVRLPAMSVYAYTTDGTLVATTTSNASGFFDLPVPPGSYRLVSADATRVYATAFSGGAPSFANAQVIDVPSPGQVRSNLTLALHRGAKIAGRVTSSAGASLAGLRVTAYNLDGTEQTSVPTDASGAYELLVAPGTVKLAAIDETQTYAAQFHRTRPDFDGATALYVVSGDALSGFDFVLAPAGRVTGLVTASAQPASGINVAAYDGAGRLSGTTTTGADGRYTLVLAPDSYRLLAYDVQYRYATAYTANATSFDAVTPIAVAANATVTADFALQRGVKMTGTVVSETGAPLDEVEIFALDSAGNRTAAAMAHDGAFTIAVVAGTYRFEAIDRSGFFAPQYSASVTVTESQTPPVIRFVMSGAGRRRSSRH